MMMRSKVIDVLRLMNDGIEKEIEHLVLQKLKAQAEPMLTELAKEMACGLQANITAYHRCMEGDIQVTLNLDGVATPYEGVKKPAD